MTNDSTAAVIYARYSSHAQREESIEQQVAVCSAWAASQGYVVTNVYHDEARSGRSTEGRDQFLRMVEDARRGTFSAVIVYKLDRFARDRYDSAMYRKKLRDLGVEVKSAMEHIPDGPEGRLLEAVIEGVAEWYSADLSQKTVRGMRANAERCLTNGVRVFGYRTAPDGTYAIDEGQAAIVRRVFAEWVAGGTSPAISRRLAAEGVRTAAGAVPDRQWARRIVHDERYVGVYSWADVRVEGGMPAIVDVPTFAAAQRRTRATSAPNRTHDYPLVGRIRDHATGLPMHGYSARGHGGEYTYYGIVVDGHRHLVRQHLVEGAVVRAVQSAFADVALVERAVGLVLERQDERSHAPEVERARRTLDEVRRGEEAAMDALSLGVSHETVRARLDALKERKRAAEAVLVASEGGLVTADEVRGVLTRIAEHVDAGEILAHAVREVVVDRDEGIVIVTLPILEKAKALTLENGSSGWVSAEYTWLPCSAPGSNRTMWAVHGGLLVLQEHMAA